MWYIKLYQRIKFIKTISYFWLQTTFKWLGLSLFSFENTLDETIDAEIKLFGYRKIWSKVASDGSIVFEEATDVYATKFINFNP